MAISHLELSNGREREGGVEIETWMQIPSRWVKRENSTRDSPRTETSRGIRLSASFPYGTLSEDEMLITNRALVSQALRSRNQIQVLTSSLFHILQPSICEHYFQALNKHANPFMPSGLSHPSKLDQFISKIRGVKYIYFFI
ncbi:hypothetical protein DPMN_163353 [Dreissena polymorpha]|uniref:Uncharacterized protein n=1 Tax=Dreissena polymorpha TaxID=45954 RepID=A0A9D4IV35_DREPO|nr:hypothetical protein DPMN_163353 [Dreissena polymorpha]